MPPVARGSQQTNEAQESEAKASDLSVPDGCSKERATRHCAWRLTSLLSSPCGARTSTPYKTGRAAMRAARAMSHAVGNPVGANRFYSMGDVARAVPAFFGTCDAEPANRRKSLQLTHRTAFSLATRAQRRARLGTPHRLAQRDKNGQARTSRTILVQASASPGFVAPIQQHPQCMKERSPTRAAAAYRRLAAGRGGPQAGKT